MKKIRLDSAVFERGLTSSRERARTCIMAGEITVNGQIADKPGMNISEDDEIVLKTDPVPYVSRGGLKLAKALDVFMVDPSDCVCMDVGASTGGFTDCLLQNGAKKVFSIDVGYGQFAYSLRNDPRVKVIERTNFRYIPFEAVGEKVDIIVTDVSFISITKLAEKFREFAYEKTKLIALIKPQFESDKHTVSNKGVVSSAEDHICIVKNVIIAMEKNGIFIKNLNYSPVKGPKGNIEFISEFTFSHIRDEINIDSIVKMTVENAHAELNK